MYEMSDEKLTTRPLQKTEQDAKAGEARKVMARIGTQLLRESKASINDKSAWKARDLLSLLVKSNMATDIPEQQRMSDQDVLARTFAPISVSVDCL